MRLVNAHTLDLEDFPDDGKPVFNDENTPPFHRELPPYAILSHTWGDDEMSYRDGPVHKNLPPGSSLKAGSKFGYLKIGNTCYEAQNRNLDYIWVDTICIDKDNPEDTDKSINSMFHWYARAEVCLVYLSDVSEPRLGDDIPLFSRWFTRGWTLPELVAPRKLVFFSGGWTLTGDINREQNGWKNDSESQRLIHTISLTTGIDRKYLDGTASLHSASVAQRMSWAAKRETREKEDIAYCLLGLFGVKMPLKYGEGDINAFRRLQEEILKTSSDQTIFAWEVRENTFNCGEGVRMLAPSPICFAASGDFVRAETCQDTTPIAVTDEGVTLNAPVLDLGCHTFLVLDCVNRQGSRKDDRICVPLLSEIDHYIRSSWPPTPLPFPTLSQVVRELKFRRLESPSLTACTILLTFDPSEHLTRCSSGVTW
ncbi:heterokaryon incompatibility protein-domain-containing protein [Whalleya microplaca]|nr:heterokaryon incompatibility protein-domain-containing protein [Whalleya microplaca]